jgi:hypothetical protein
MIVLAPYRNRDMNCRLLAASFGRRYGVFLPKPYTSNRIINALRECIGTAWRAPFVQILRGG